MAAILDSVIRIALVVPTALLFFLVLQAYLRIKSRKMLLITTGFGIFFVHALISVPELFSSAFHVLLDENAHLALNLIALIFILLGTLED